MITSKSKIKSLKPPRCRACASAPHLLLCAARYRAGNVSLAATRIERSAVNVTVENLASCQKIVRIEVDAQAVDAMFASITKEFQKQASVPGFRPGKAPVAMVL